MRKLADWWPLASCRGLADVFFPTSDNRPLTDARKICAECQVRVECVEYGMSLTDPKIVRPTINRGIWGGYSADELNQMRENKPLTDHVCERPGCTNRTPRRYPKRETPARFCSQKCRKAIWPQRPADWPTHKEMLQET